jgi:hypothetical protein
MTRRQAGLLLALAHVALVGSLGLKLLVDRARLPRAWARTMPFDPSTPLRGRYVRLGVEVPLESTVAGDGADAEPGVRLRAVDGRVVGTIDSGSMAPRLQLRHEGGGLSSSRLAEPVAFFIPEHVPDPSIRQPGEELWVELTLPKDAWPRPIRLGVMRAGKLIPLELR